MLLLVSSHPVNHIRFLLTLNSNWFLLKILATAAAFVSRSSKQRLSSPHACVCVCAYMRDCVCVCRCSSVVILPISYFKRNTLYSPLNKPSQCEFFFSFLFASASFYYLFGNFTSSICKHLLRFTFFCTFRANYFHTIMVLIAFAAFLTLVLYFFPTLQHTLLTYVLFNAFIMLYIQLCN